MHTGEEDSKKDLHIPDGWMRGTVSELIDEGEMFALTLIPYTCPNTYIQPYI